MLVILPQGVTLRALHLGVPTHLCSLTRILRQVDLSVPFPSMPCSPSSLRPYRAYRSEPPWGLLGAGHGFYAVMIYWAFPLRPAPCEVSPDCSVGRSASPWSWLAHHPHVLPLVSVPPSLRTSLPLHVCLSYSFRLHAICTLYPHLVFPTHRSLVFP